MTMQSFEKMYDKIIKDIHMDNDEKLPLLQSRKKLTVFWGHFLQITVFNKMLSSKKLKIGIFRMLFQLNLKIYKTEMIDIKHNF